LNILLSVVCCHPQLEFSDAIRRTWLSAVSKDKADVRFFFGRGATRELRDDEVFLDCGDDYSSLPSKVQHIFKWAHAREYTHVLKCDCDVVLNADAVLSSDFSEYDFVGPRNCNGKISEIHTPWGFNYWLSRKAMKLVIDSPLPPHTNDEAWVSTVLYTNGIFLHDDQRYFLHRGAPKCLRPLQRPLRAPKRPMPVEVIAPPDTFAWCVYTDSGLQNIPLEDRIKEFYRVYEAQKHVIDGRASEGT